MSKWRVIAINALLTLIIAGNLFVITVDRPNHLQPEWPFICYRMFSYLTTSTVFTYSLYGVAVDEKGKESEFRLDDDKYITPFATRDPQRLATSCKQTRNCDSVLKAFANMVMSRHKLRPEEVRVDAGPPMVEVRYYREVWSVSPGVLPAMPTERQLLASSRSAAQ